jgi:hypothetical protein
VNPGNIFLLEVDMQWTFTAVLLALLLVFPVTTQAADENAGMFCQKLVDVSWDAYEMAEKGVNIDTANSKLVQKFSGKINTDEVRLYTDVGYSKFEYEKKKSVDANIRTKRGFHEACLKAVEENKLEEFFDSYVEDVSDYQMMPEKGYIPKASHKGKVVRKMDSDSYTYFVVEEEAGNRFWVVLPQTTLSVGDVVEFPDTEPMLKFSAKNLKCVFSVILFVPSVRVWK